MNTHVMEKVLAKDNLKAAWKQVKSNKGAPGIDGVGVEAYPEIGRKKWPKALKGLRGGNYIPSPVKRVEIPKKTGGKRILGIPTVQDRLIQQAISQALTPFFDPEFSESSFGYRPGRSAHDAIYQMQKYVNMGYSWVVDIDLTKFFDNVNHDILMHNVAKKVRDKTLLRLIGRYLRSGVLIGKTILPTEIGTPQGGPLSPILSNILLDVMDKELEKRNLKFCRYADDMRIFVRSEGDAIRVMREVSDFLGQKLKLKVNRDKSKITRANNCSFLGFTLKNGKIRWTESSFRDFRYNLKKLTGRSNGVSLHRRVIELNQYIRGWMNYFGISQYYRAVQDIDGWLRRRIRMCLWKQWRYTKTKVKNLLRLGLSESMAVKAGMSSKSFWHLSRTYATNLGMSNNWFEKQGLVSIKALWCKSQGYVI